MANNADEERQKELPIEGMVVAQEAVGDDEEDTNLIRQMGKAASDYCNGFEWCDSVQQVYFGGGVGGILCVFLLSIVPAREGIGEWIWVVLGDIPAAYLPLEDSSSPKEVFDTYLRGINNWVSFAKKGKTGTPDDGVPPIDAPATPENAAILERRLGLIKELLTPIFD